MHFKGLDLNLLVAFHALMKQRSVTRAADELRVTQSALSHALDRLRLYYKDRLFVRANGAMHPTSRAMEIAGTIMEALQKVSETFGRDFDPASIRRTFKVGLVDFPAAFLLPALMERVGISAPDAQVTADHMSLEAAKRLLGTPDLDFAIGAFPVTPPACESEPLINDPFSVIARQDHPEIGRKLTLATYARLRHIDVPYYRSVDAVLRKRGVVRSFTVRAENVLTVPFIVARSTLLATVPRSFARIFGEFCKLRVLNPPFDVDSFRIKSVWHRRSKDDPAHAWFAKVVRSIIRDLNRDFQVQEAGERKRR